MLMAVVPSRWRTSPSDVIVVASGVEGYHVGPCRRRETPTPIRRAMVMMTMMITTRWFVFAACRRPSRSVFRIVSASAGGSAAEGRIVFAPRRALALTMVVVVSIVVVVVIVAGAFPRKFLSLSLFHHGDE